MVKKRITIHLKDTNTNKSYNVDKGDITIATWGITCTLETPNSSPIVKYIPWSNILFMDEIPQYS